MYPVYNACESSSVIVGNLHIVVGEYNAISVVKPATLSAQPNSRCTLSHANLVSYWALY